MFSLNNRLFNKTLDIMGKSMGLRLARHSMTATNLANMDTPGYQVKDLNFEQTLQNVVDNSGDKLEMRQTNYRHMPVKNIESAYLSSQRDIRTSPYGKDEKGQDIVDIDKEMTKLAKNHLIYNATAQMLAKEFDSLKNAIKEGGN